MGKKKHGNRGRVEGEAISKVRERIADLSDDMVQQGGMDEEISEDGAFNSDDEERYGHFFEKRDDADVAGDENEPTLLGALESSSSESESSSGDDDEDDEVPLHLLKTLDAIDGLHGSKPAEKRAQDMIDRANMKVQEEGAFNAISEEGKLSLSDMINSLGDSQKDIGLLKRNLERLESAAQIKTPAAKVVEERTERKVAYEKAREDAGEWLPIVEENRKAASLSFPLNEAPRIHSSTTNIVSGFKPKTELEREIEAVLKESGLSTEEEIKKKEETDLEQLNVDPEQMRARQGELAKLRALMFYSEQKAKRAKKIKSKMYRRLKKRREARAEEKELEELKEVDSDAVREMQEKALMDRTKERMTLRHKNTSKFVRGLLKHGGSKKAYTREMIQEQLDVERNLKKKMKSMDEGSDVDDEGSDDEDGSDAEARALRAAKALQKQIENDTCAPAPKGIFGLKFMQRGLDKQREEAKRDTEVLRRAIESNGEKDDLDADADADAHTAATGRRSFNVTAKELKEQKGDKRRNTQEDKPKPSSKQKAVNAKTSGAIKAAPDLNDKPRLFTVPEFDVPVVSPSESPEKETNNEDREGNPWIDNEQKSSRLKSKKRSRRQDEDTKEVSLDVKKSLLKESRGEKEVDDEAQAELIRRAFAGTNALADDFAEEKVQEEMLEADRKQAKETEQMKQPGWGSWASSTTLQNAMKKKADETEERKQVLLMKQKNRKRKKNHVVISNKRNKKVAKYMVDTVPYPFTSREQYERSLSNPLGSDFNTAYAFNKSIKPLVITRPGAVIDPISKAA